MSLYLIVVKTMHNDQHLNFVFIECQDKIILNDVAIYALENMQIDGLLLSYKYNEFLYKFSLRRLRVNAKIAMHKITEQYSGGDHAHAASFFQIKNHFQFLIQL